MLELIMYNRVCDRVLCCGISYIRETRDGKCHVHLTVTRKKLCHIHVNIINTLVLKYNGGKHHNM